MAGVKGRSGRPTKVQQQTAQHIREKIRGSVIVTTLMQHIEGHKKMEPSQVTASLGLLKKIVPDLQAVEHSGEVHNSALAELLDVIDQRQGAIPSEKRKPNGAANGSGSIH